MARYDTTDDLASAVRDVVHISRNGTSQPVGGSPSRAPVSQAQQIPSRARAENPFDETSGVVDSSRGQFAK
jgi:hypothetical protein